MDLGRFGEAWTVGYLSRLGYRIIERNVRYRVGEIDLVTEDGNELVFVEVKCRRTRQYGTPQAAVTRARYGRLAGAVEEYLMRNELSPESYRIDVVALEVDAAGKVRACDHLKAVEVPAE